MRAGVVELDGAHQVFDQMRALGDASTNLVFGRGSVSIEYGNGGASWEKISEFPGLSFGTQLEQLCIFFCSEAAVEIYLLCFLGTCI